MNFRKISVGALALLVLVSCGRKGGEQEVVVKPYPMMTVSPERAELQNVYPVTIKGQDDAEIRPRVDGTIEAIYVKEGDMVRKGQSLFKLDSPYADQELQTAKAAVISAEAALRTAELNVEKTKPLAEKGIVSNYQLKTVENVYDTSKATLEQAKAALASARAKADWARVVSPIDGVVGSIPYLIGNYVNSANALTTIANTKNVYAYFSLNEKELLDFVNRLEGNTYTEKVKNIPPVQLRMANGEIYAEEGRIEAISGVVDGVTGSASLRAIFPNMNGQLKSGISGRILVPSFEDNVFVIPQKATFKQQDKVLVYKFQGDSVVSAQVKVLAMPDGVRYAVTEGLEDKETIVTDGLATLVNGQKVKPE